MNQAEWLWCVCERLRMPLKPGTRVLDIGCGSGELVHAFRSRGIDAFGCDLRFKDGPRTAALHAAGVLKLIERHPYRLPFDDAFFDLVVSVSVMEHVMNVGDTLHEMARITRSGGRGLHIFPSRYRLIEPHTFVPLGTVLRGKPWLRFWASLGIKNSFQVKMNSVEVASANGEYLRQSTHYLAKRSIREAFELEFSSVRFCEDLLVSCAAGSISNRIGLGRAMQFSRTLTRLYSAARERAVWVEK